MSLGKHMEGQWESIPLKTHSKSSQRSDYNKDILESDKQPEFKF